MKKAPLVFWVQDLWPESLSAAGAVRSKWVLNRVAALVSFIYQGCDLVLVQSRAFVDRVRALGTPANKIRYFPNSAEDLYHPTPRETVPQTGALPDGFLVMFAGNIGVAQSFETILDAAERLRRCRLVITTTSGFDQIDLQALRARGIACARLPLARRVRHPRALPARPCRRRHQPPWARQPLRRPHRVRQVWRVRLLQQRLHLRASLLFQQQLM